MIVRAQRTQRIRNGGRQRVLVALLLLVLVVGCGEQRSSSRGAAADVVQTSVIVAPTVSPTQVQATPTAAPPSPTVVPTSAGETATPDVATADGTLVDIGGYRLYRQR